MLVQLHRRSTFRLGFDTGYTASAETSGTRLLLELLLRRKAYLKRGQDTRNLDIQLLMDVGGQYKLVLRLDRVLKLILSEKHLRMGPTIHSDATTLHLW